MRSSIFFSIALVSLYFVLDEIFCCKGQDDAIVAKQVIVTKLNGLVECLM